MDKRIPIVTVGGRTFVFGRGFDTLGEAEQYADQVIARREKIAGRSLTAIELQHGPDHREDRDVRQRQADASWRPYGDDAPPPSRNIYTAARERGELDRPRRETREQMYRRLEAAEDQRLASEDAKAAFDADPKRIAQISRAEDLLERVKWNPSQPRSVVVRAEQLVRQAREGRLDAPLRQMANDLVGLLNDQKEAKAKEIESRVQELRQEKHALWEEPEPVAPPVEGTPAIRADGTIVKTAAEFEAAARHTAEFDRRLGR